MWFFRIQCGLQVDARIAAADPRLRSLTEARAPSLDAHLSAGRRRSGGGRVVRSADCMAALTVSLLASGILPQCGRWRSHACGSRTRVPLMPAEDEGSDGMLSRRLYIGGVPFGMSETEVRRLFDGAALPHEVTPVEEVCLIHDQDGRPKGYGFVTLATIEQAERAKKLLHRRAITYGGRMPTTLVIRAASAPKGPREPPVAGRLLWVGNLPFGSSPEAVRAAFAEAAELPAEELWCSIRRDRAGRSLGHGTVRFPDAASAARALAGMQGNALEGRALQARALASRPGVRAPLAASLGHRERAPPLLPAPTPSPHPAPLRPPPLSTSSSHPFPLLPLPLPPPLPSPVLGPDATRSRPRRAQVQYDRRAGAAPLTPSGAPWGTLPPDLPPVDAVEPTLLAEMERELVRMRLRPPVARAAP